MNLKEKMKHVFAIAPKDNRGFTLVELIVVIAILAILGGVAVPAYSGYVKKAERAADEQLLAEMNTAFASACAINGESHIGQTPKATIEDGKAKVTVTNKTKIEEDFAALYGEGGVFKYFDTLGYNSAEGVFVGSTLTELAKALKDAWNGSSFAAGGEAVVQTLLGAFDGISGYFTMAGDMDLEDWLLNNVSDELADALGLRGMLDGFNVAVSVSDEELESYLSENVDGYANMTDDQKKALKETMKGNMGVLHFASDAATRSVEDVKSSVDNFLNVLGAAGNSVDSEYLKEYYYSTLDDAGKAWFDSLSDAEKNNQVEQFKNNETAISLGELKLSGEQAAALGQAAEMSGASNTAGVSTLGSMYALAAGYYSSDIYKNSSDYDPNFTPDFSNFASCMSALDCESFEEYYETNGVKDMEAYLSFMSYLSENPSVDMESNSAFTGQYGYIADALGMGSK